MRPWQVPTFKVMLETNTSAFAMLNEIQERKQIEEAAVLQRYARRHESPATSPGHKSDVTS